MERAGGTATGGNRDGIMKHDQDETGPASDGDGTEVHCRRTGEKYSATEHEKCPYCFGNKAEIAPGEHQQFCGYDEKKDPIHFGFPDDTQRQRSG